MPVEGEGEYGWRNGFKALLKLPRSAIYPLHPLVKDTACDPVSVEVISNSEQTEGHVVDPYKFSNWFVIIVELWSMYDKAVHTLTSLSAARGLHPHGLIFLQIPHPKDNYIFIV
jgi:hypothetical protein